MIPQMSPMSWLIMSVIMILNILMVIFKLNNMYFNNISIPVTSHIMNSFSWKW